MRRSLFIAMLLPSAAVAEDPNGESTEIAEASYSDIFKRDWYAEA